MSSIWSLDTHGNPLGKVRDLIRTIWLETGLNGMLVTMDEGVQARHCLSLLAMLMI